MIRRRAVVVANEIRLHRSQHKGTFLLVEGRDDRLFCERVTEPSVCKIIVAEGKHNVCEVVRILDDGPFTGALGLVDSNHDHIEGRTLSSPNLIATDMHDLECMLIRSSALDAVMVEFGSKEKVANFDRDVLDTLLCAAGPIGALRLYSERSRIGLRFDGLRYSRFVNQQDLTIDRGTLIQEVLNRSGQPAVLPASLAKGI